MAELLELALYPEKHAITEIIPWQDLAFGIAVPVGDVVHQFVDSHNPGTVTTGIGQAAVDLTTMQQSQPITISFLFQIEQSAAVAKQAHDPKKVLLSKWSQMSQQCLVSLCVETSSAASVAS